jgi:MerR family transcriptional regulator/heat shock protein HspR
LVRPRGAAGRELLFGEPELARLRRIRRLIEELGLNVAGVEVVLRLLDDLELLRSTVEQRTVPNSARSGAS